jgi:small subunit ribosomal protein S2
LSDESENKEQVANEEVESGATVESIEEQEKVEGEFLLPIDTLLSAGIHIGTRIKTKDMIPFIYRVRPDGLFVLDAKKTDERIRMGAKFIARFDPKKIVAISSRLYGRTPVQKFCDVTGCLAILGRFLPGLFTNANHSDHIEAELLIVNDPKADWQAVSEASAVGMPVMAFCDTDNDFRDVDFVIPINNKGRRSLATVYWLLAREIMKIRGEIPQDGTLQVPLDSFETKLVEAPVDTMEE